MRPEECLSLPVISCRVNCSCYQPCTKVLFSSVFIPELRGSADNDNSLVFRVGVAGTAVKPRSQCEFPSCLQHRRRRRRGECRPQADPERRAGGKHQREPEDTVTGKRWGEKERGERH